MILVQYFLDTFGKDTVFNVPVYPRVKPTFSSFFLTGEDCTSQSHALMCLARTQYTVSSEEDM